MNTNLSKYKTTAFLLLVAILLIINSHRASAQSCVYSVSPTTLEFEYNPSETNGVQAVYVDAPFWCDTYTAEPGESWINVLHIDYEEQVVYIVPDDNFECSVRYGYVNIDGINVTIEQEGGLLPEISSITGSSTKCTGKPSTYWIYPVSGATNYTWSATNGGSIISGQGTHSAVISFSNTGISVVSVYASNSCDISDTAFLNVTVNQSPGASIGGNTPVFVGETINLTSSPANCTYSWTGPNNFTSNQQNPTLENVTRNNLGEYTVIVSNVSCSDTLTKDILVCHQPLAESNSPVNVGQNINLHASEGDFYYWNGPGLFISTNQEPVRPNATLGMAGVYNVYITDIEGCFYQTSTVVTVNEIPIDPDEREINTSLPVGTINGSYDVSSTGGLAYQFPIKIAPGTAGLEPSVSINYNSQSGIGLLGPGWDIGGISRITRVPNTLYHDSQIKGISLSTDDRFALDGNRLIKTSTGGTYGGDGVVYHTEMETFSEVISHGTAGNGPAWFEVKTKEGLTIYYGNTNDSKVEPVTSTTPYMWLINRITDPFNNYIDFEYSESNGESVISKIKYTGQVNGDNPYNEIQFNYSEKIDKGKFYIQGTSISQNKLLEKINVLCEQVQIREYNFKYRYINAITVLNEIIESDGDENDLNSTLIEWGENTPQFSQVTSFSSGNEYNFQFADYNGDGKDDFIRTWSNNWELCINQDGTSFTTTDGGTLGSDLLYVLYKIPIPSFSNDFNGDHFDDILIRKTYNSPPEMGGDIAYTYYVRFSEGTTLDDLNIYNFVTVINDHEICVGDFDGNGILEIFAYQYGENPVGKIHSYHSNNTWNNFNISGWDNEIKIHPVDFDSDGRTELMVIDGSYCKIYRVNYISGTEFTLSLISNENGFVTETDGVFPGDFNGDGKTDLLIGDSNGWEIRYSNGIGWVSSSISLPLVKKFDFELDEGDGPHFFVNDFNGDGLSDILEVYKFQDGINIVNKINVYYCRNVNFIKESYNFDQGHTSKSCYNFGDFNGDGKQEFFYRWELANAFIIRFHPNEKSTLAHSITDGFNNKTEFVYKPLTDNSVYTKGTGAPNPDVIDIQAPIYVVSSIVQQDGIGGTITVNYSYEGAKLHTRGHGFLGFMKTTSSSNVLDIKNIASNVLNTSKYVLLNDKTETKRYDNTNISKTDNSFSIFTDPLLPDKIFIPQLDNSVLTNYLTGVASSSFFTFDNKGNLTKDSTLLGNDVTIVTDNQYEAFIFETPNRKTHEKVRKIYTGKDPFPRETDYDYDTNGALETVITDYGTSKAVTKSYEYTSRGVVESETTSSGNLLTIVYQYEYDSKQRFPVTTINPENLELSREYDHNTGNATSETGYNGLTMSYEYDGFGNLTTTTTPRNHEIESSVEWYTGGSIPNALYYSTTVAPGRPDETVYYDILGREVYRQYDGRSGTVISSKEYNPKEQLTEEILPHYSSDPSPEEITYYYNIYGKLASKTANGVTMQFSYPYGYNQKTTQNLQTGQSSTEYYNSAGDITQITDNGGTVTYDYHSSGQIKQINYGNHVISIGYDDLGRQNSLTDPNSGLTTYSYNAYGQLVSQTDEKSNTYNMYYDDEMGRLTSKTGPDGTTYYVYYKTAVPEYGKDSLITNYNDITELFTYNNYGQLATMTEEIDVTAYEYEYGYDIYGNLTSQTFPSGLEISRQYDSNGYLKRIYRTSDTLTLWSFNTEYKPGIIDLYRRAPGLLTKVSFDSHHFPSNYHVYTTSNSFQDLDLEFDYETGNLLSRTDNIKDLTESFDYDNLDRLTVSDVENGSGYQMDIDFFSNGNIDFKTNTGDYYAYDGTQKNAIKEIRDNPETISDLAQTINYTAFHSVADITEGTKEIEFTYGSDDQRRKSVYSVNSTVEKTTVYGAGFDKIIDEGGTRIRFFHYIDSPNGLAAIIIKNGANETVYFPVTDHLGSILGLVNQSCTSVVEEYSFDAWGKRRNPANWSYSNIPTPTLLTRGYTGHEHLDEFGLINMNGRVYDPIVGRFLSPDNYVQMPFSTQGYNRYSYCLNNPLKYADPDGEFFLPWLFAFANAYYCGAMANNVIDTLPPGLKKTFKKSFKFNHPLSPGRLINGQDYFH